MNRTLLLLLVLIFSCELVYSQDFLLLSRPGKKKRFKYYAGDELVFQLNRENHFNRAKIVGLTSDSVYFQNTGIKITEIQKVDIRDKNEHLWRPEVFSGAFMTAGVGYFTVHHFNQIIVKQRGLKIDGGVAKWSAYLIAASYLIHLSKLKYFRVNKRNKISVVTF